MNQTELITQIQQKRGELSLLEARKETAKKEYDSLLIHLETERRELEGIRNKFDSVFSIEEKRMEERLEKNTKLVAEQSARLIRITKEQKKYFSIFTDTLTNVITRHADTLTKTDKFSKNAVILGNASEALLDVLNKSIQRLNDMLEANKSYETTLENKEKDLIKREKIATQTMQRAEELMYWHNKPGKYRKA